MPENVNVLEYRFNTFPAKFSWRGQVFQVDAVNECKTRRASYHYWVRCGGKSLQLVHLFHSNRWQLEIEEGGQK